MDMCRGTGILQRVVRYAERAREGGIARQREETGRIDPRLPGKDAGDLIAAESFRDRDHVALPHPGRELMQDSVDARPDRNRVAAGLEIAVVPQDAGREHEEGGAPHEPVRLEDPRDRLDTRPAWDHDLARLIVARDGSGKEEDAGEEHDADDSSQDEGAAEAVASLHRSALLAFCGRSSQRWRISPAPRA